LTAVEWKSVSHRIKKREAQNHSSVVYFNGSLIPEKKWKKEVSRHTHLTLRPESLNGRCGSLKTSPEHETDDHQEAPSPATPDDVQVMSPMEIVHVDITENLPWFRYREFADSHGKFCDVAF
jgi:hypothetical protein